MEIKIVINELNKERVFFLLRQLAEAEEAGLKEPNAASTRQREAFGLAPAKKDHNQLDQCFESAKLSLLPGSVARKPLGAWAMFNSFLPGKATLRVLGHMVWTRKSEAVAFGDLIEESVRSIRALGLSGVRGFPGSHKASAIPRFANHLVLPFSEMGMISSRNENGIRTVGLTEPGFRFSLLKNPLLDDDPGRGQLSEDERQWMRGYLRKIDREGFGEYSLLKLFAELIEKKRPGREGLVDWFYNKPDFREYTRSHSKHANEPKKLERQLLNLASTYVSSKIALLRELGVVSDARGVYDLEAQL